MWYFTPRRYQGRSPKWQRMYTGPFVVEARCGPVNYRIRKTAHSRPITVHVDKLRPCRQSESVEDAAETTAPSISTPTVHQRPRREARLPARFR